MIVDDEAFIRQSFADWFEDRNWIPLEAESGEQALEIMETESPDCAIVDVRMGGMTGDDFIRRACRRKPEMTFLICTGSPEYGIPADLLDLSCVCEKVFRKPVTNFRALEETMTELIMRNRTKRA